MHSEQTRHSIEQTAAPVDGLALWFLGQNGFVLKTHAGTRLAIDPYLTDSCAEKYRDSGFDLSRILPEILRPEDLEVDYFVVTHSHDDHLDEETVRRLRCKPVFVAPWQAAERLLAWGVAPERVLLLHPSQQLQLGDITVEGTFALPTDGTDLNHIGLLFTAANGVRFYNTGDTAYAEALSPLLPTGVDLCAICINGGFHNLSHGEAARIIRAVAPHTVIPTHYDMMRCNLGDPESFRTALQLIGSKAIFHRMSYGEPLLYRREQRGCNQEHV